MIEINPNQFKGTDSERIEQSIAAVKTRGGGKIVISRREDEDGRDFWLLDRAILLDSNMTLVIDNCTLKLSDNCRDNFIRSANCGIGIRDVRKVHDIHVIGIGNALLQGADKPRSTGDSAKLLGIPSYNHGAPGGPRSYGTDAGKENERPKGDWRNIGILLAYLERFSVSHLTIRDSHAWAMSHEHCSNGFLSHLRFESTAKKLIDGRIEYFLNQDGIDLRQGCHDIIIENITGHTGDDLIALTTIGDGKTSAGEISSTMVAGTLPTDDDDISHIIIRDVLGHSAGHCQTVRFLNSNGTKIHDIVLENLMDDSTSEEGSNVTVLIGDQNPAWGGVTPLGDTFGFILNNIHAHGNHCIKIAGSLSDSMISNVINHNPDAPPISYESGMEYTRRLTLTNLHSIGCQDDAPSMNATKSF